MSYPSFPVCVSQSHAIRQLFPNHMRLYAGLSSARSSQRATTLLLQKPLGILNQTLSGREHLAGDSFSVADLNVASILAWGKLSRLDFSPHPSVARWLERALERPAYKRMWDSRRKVSGGL